MLSLLIPRVIGFTSLQVIKRSVFQEPHKQSFVGDRLKRFAKLFCGRNCHALIVLRFLETRLAS